eukprot:scpid39786/ scgid5952/ ATP-dependent RNA helicase DDX1; DEAD box protein 1
MSGYVVTESFMPDHGTSQRTDLCSSIPVYMCLRLARDRQSFGWGGTGKKSFGGQFDSYGGPFGKDDVIGCFLDLDCASIKFSKNGHDMGKAFDIPEALYHSDFCAGITLKKAELRVNFGDQPFRYQPTKGFVGLAQAKEKFPQHIAGQKQKENGQKGPRRPMALIIEPSRELAQQTHDIVIKLKRHLKSPQLEALLVVGGSSPAEQISALDRGVDIVTGTPGRIEDLVSNGQLKLDNVRFYILDEADGLLTQGYEKFIMSMYSQIPSSQPDGRRMQMVVCSATLHSFEVKKLAERVMHFPTWVDLKGQDSVPETVHHSYCFIDPEKDSSWHSLKRSVTTDGVHQRDNTRAGMVTKEAMSEAVKRLKGEYLVRAIDVHRMDQAIIFCRTKLDCDNLEQYLNVCGGGGRSNKYSCVCLHSDRKPQERKANLEQFKAGQAKFLICTDVAARGIDVRGVPFMINVTLPDEKQNYIHRIGRVGRAERMGLAISLVSTVEEKVWYHKCPSRGKSCNNTRLVEQGGCTIWYNEVKLLRDVEAHLDITIPQVEADLKVEQNEFDGKVTYGQKKKPSSASVYDNHVEQLASSVADLSRLENHAQSSFLRMRYMTNWTK